MRAIDIYVMAAEWPFINFEEIDGLMFGNLVELGSGSYGAAYLNVDRQVVIKEVGVGGRPWDLDLEVVALQHVEGVPGV